MLELIVAVVTATGFLGLIGIILKWLVSAMGKHVDRMSKHVDNLERAFHTQSERLISGVGSVQRSLDNHIQEEDKAHASIAHRLDAGDKFNNILLERIHSIESKVDIGNGNGVRGGNGVH